jgi:CBS domain-containing protein
MAQTVQELMTPNPVTLEETASVLDAARAMRDKDIGVVVIVGNGEVRGILTDRDIVVRVVAEGRDPQSTRVGEFASRDLVTVSPDEPADEALRLMRERSIRRVVVTQSGRAVGILSLGDVAKEREARGALADIRTAPGNN